MDKEKHFNDSEVSDEDFMSLETDYDKRKEEAEDVKNLDHEIKRKEISKNMKEGFFSSSKSSGFRIIGAQRGGFFKK